MNVLIVVPWDQDSGGVASVVGNLARQLQKQGHKPLFLHFSNNNCLRRKTTKWNFTGFDLNLRSPFLARTPVKSVLAFLCYLIPTLVQLCRLIVMHRIDIVNIHYPDTYYVYFVVLKWICRFRLVVSVHGTEVMPEGKPLETYPRSLSLLLNSVDMLVAPSQAMLDSLLLKYPQLTDRAKAIHNGVNLEEFERPAELSTPEQRYILCVAFYHPLKALDVLIRAFHLFHRSHRDVKLWLAGEGPIRSQLESLIRELNLYDYVKLLGYRSPREIRTLLHQCSLFVLPSRAEPFGIALIEAMACAKPVVATAVGGIPEIVAHDQNGLLVQPDHPEALCSAMTTLWENPAHATQLSAAGHRTVAERFQWNIIGAIYVDAFSRLNLSMSTGLRGTGAVKNGVRA